MAWWDQLLGNNNSNSGLVPSLNLYGNGPNSAGTAMNPIGGLNNGDTMAKGKDLFNFYTGTGPYDPQAAARAGLSNQIGLANEQGNAASNFAATNQQGYNGVDTNNLNQSRQYLQDLASGKNSVAALQLQQGLAQNLAAQRSMAAGAAPQNSAAAARIAANNQAKLGYGMSGQQALAGLQERNAAQQQLSGLDLARRQQDLQGALQSRQNAIGAYGQGIQGYGTQLQNPEKSLGPALLGGFSGLMGMAASDERLKTDVEEGDAAAKSMLDGLKAYSFKYKDEKYGKGKQFGILAQDLEKAGLKHTVVDTPSGKMVHGAKAGTTALGLVAALGRRVAELEKKGA